MYWQQCSSEKNANTALDLAQRITVYNHRLNEGVPRKSSGECQAQQQEKPAVQVRMIFLYRESSSLKLSGGFWLLECKDNELRLGPLTIFTFTPYCDPFGFHIY